jgi:hypothetical protein
MSAYVIIPSQLTLNKVPESIVDQFNAVHVAFGLPTIQAGDSNPYYLDLNDLDMGGVPFHRDARPGLAVAGPINNFDYISIPQCQLAVAFGGDVEGLPVWFEITDLEAVCPFSDSDETWETWGVFGQSHMPVEIEGKWYRSNAVGESGELLPASVFLGAGVPILTLAEYQAIQPVIEL